MRNLPGPGETKPAQKTPKMPGKSGKKILVLLAAAVIFMGLVVVFLFRGRLSKPFDANLLVITLDTTRADCLGVYGGEGNHTANLDALARKGILFENCVTPVPLTLPAHVSLFTGRTPLAHQVRNNARYALGSEELTLAERFKGAGFRSYAVVASYVLLGRFGLKQGFDEYDDSLDSFKVMNSFNTEIPANAVSSRFLTWLEGHKDDKFFAWVHFYDPHEPYAPPNEYRSGPGESDPKRLYLGEVEFMDHHVGKILEGLKRLGLGSKTLVVVVGDHGEAFAEHGENGHAVFGYEENLRVPLILYHETLLPKNAVVEERVGLIDIVPTLLEMYGLEAGGGLHGRSLVPFFRPKGKIPPPRPFYLESFYGFEEMGWAPLTGLVDGGLKFISLPRPELYDLRQDPGERDNLFETRPEQAARLKKLLASYVSSHTELNSAARRELTPEDVRQLQSLGYVSSGSGERRTDRDPKDGIALEAKLAGIIKDAEKVPSREIEAEVDRFLAENGIDKGLSVFARLWRAYEKRKDRESVLRVLREAIETFPDDVGFRMQLASAYYAAKQYDRVVGLGREILERDPANSVARILMGDAFAASGDAEAAQDELEKALEIEPENVSLRIKYAELLITRRKIPEALAAYDLLLRNEDVLKDHEFLFKLALFFAQNGRDGQAVELIERSCRLHPSGRYYFFLGALQARLGKDAESMASIRIALEKYAEDLSPDQRAQAEKLLRSPS